MRYGVIRFSSDLPHPGMQRRLIEAMGCDILLEEGLVAAGGRRSLMQLMRTLRNGDEVLTYSLDVFDVTTGELATLLRRLFETGVTLKILGGSRVETLAPSGVIPRALALLADHEARRPDNAPARRRARTTDAPLTQHQLRFARDMQRRGQSMRAIGLLFRLTPNEIAAALRAPDMTDPADLADDEGARPDV